MADKIKYRDRALYLKQAVDRRRKKLRQQSIEHKGGRCYLCGYNACVQALEFHHRDSSQKEFGISADGVTRSWQRIQKELKKCVLLCASCHREVHAGIMQLPVVTLVEKRGEFGGA